MNPKADYRVHVCFGPNCSLFNPKELLQTLEDEVRAQGLEDKVSIQLSACRQRCEQSPSLNVYPGPVYYNRLTPDAIRAIVRQHLTGGEPVAEYLFRPGLKGPPRRPPVAPKGRPEPERPEKRKWQWW
ncbi:MAG TPA: (2Fe-2S) ferredoxin domain-containing protein [Thermomicrobiales bacterium]|nr:(2Fe-2S) ferredoxin domain-containing protein [Thermomicrobiales bacterium]